MQILETVKKFPTTLKVTFGSLVLYCVLIITGILIDIEAVVTGEEIDAVMTFRALIRMAFMYCLMEGLLLRKPWAWKLGSIYLGFLCAPVILLFSIISFFGTGQELIVAFLNFPRWFIYMNIVGFLLLFTAFISLLLPPSRKFFKGTGVV